MTARLDSQLYFAKQSIRANAMLKLFVKLMLLALVLALAGPFVLKGPDGQPWLRLTDLKWPEFSLPASSSGSAPLSAPTQADSKQWIRWSKDALPNPDRLTREQLALLDIKVQAHIYYRWQDANGTWQFSTLPNRNTTNIIVRTDPDANVLQSLPADQISRAFGQSEGNLITQENPAANGKGMESGNLPIPTTLPVTEIPKLIEQVKAVQDIAKQRLHSMENNY